jgi:RNA polymerase sigma-70 factor (ECF subfamily)
VHSVAGADGFRASAQEPAEADEAGLVRAAQDRPEAFAVLYERHVDRIHRYLELRVGAPDAADLTQQVFLKAFASLHRYTGRGLPFSAWLFRIARNLAMDHHRSSHRTPDELLPDVVQIESSSPEESALQMEMLGRLRSLLHDLSAEKRELLAMRFGAGLTSREIGAVLGKSEAAVKKQLTRILQRIKEKYLEP